MINFKAKTNINLKFDTSKYDTLGLLSIIMPLLAIILFYFNNLGRYAAFLKNNRDGLGMFAFTPLGSPFDNPIGFVFIICGIICGIWGLFRKGQSKKLCIIGLIITFFSRDLSYSLIQLFV